MFHCGAPKAYSKGTWAYSYGYTQSAALGGFGLVYQDTYIFGKGYLGLTAVEVPEKYYSIGK
ncbi:MAG: hypothetical protein LBO82_05720 [Synergistaceae bacterium]|jgi:hypothetical protein|nr:hypothetical protein [Synergistaceae bacterium]